MRKLTRKSLEELAKTLPVIEDRFQKSYVGGGDGTSTSPYTAAEFDNMLSEGSWNGGYVDGMGYVGNDTVCTNDNPSNAGGDGTSANPYTKAEFDSMLSNDNWNGGYVEGMGYVANDTYIYGNSTYPGQTSQHYYTFPDYVTSISMSGANQVAGAIIAQFPILGTATSYYIQEVGDMTRDIQKELLEKGYDGSSSFTIVRTSMEKSTKYSVYDANNGELITSRTINTTGFWE